MNREFLIVNEQGIHARPATELVHLANQYQAKMTITYNGATADLKSIMGVLSLGVVRGSTIEIDVEGTDAPEAMNDITKFFQALRL